jgi:hypothetical protein
MKLFYRVTAGAALMAFPLPVLAAPIAAVLYKEPQCSCCENYAAYLEQNGFKLDVKPTNDLAEITAAAEFPRTLRAAI